MEKKRVVIIGGGLAGLSCAYYLSKKKFEVIILEKQPQLGGLASGFKMPGWQWSAERTVHHIFKNDDDIIEFVKEIGFSAPLFKKPISGSVYLKDKVRFFALDSLLSFLSFPYLSLVSKLRTGLVILFLKLSPFLKYFEKISSHEFIKKYMGEESFKIMWKQLFRKKYGKYAGKVLASFFWARIKKRTPQLGYFKGGFQSLIDHLTLRLQRRGVKILSKVEVVSLVKEKRFILAYKENGRKKVLKADLVVGALQLPIFIKLAKGVLPKDFLEKAANINYLNAISLAIESDKPIIKDFYWINNSVESFPFTGVFQHTNFMDKKFYGRKHFGYIGWYCDWKDKVWQMKSEELVKYVKPFILKLNPEFNFENIRVKLFKAPYAQPIFDRKFVELNLSVETPVKGLFFAGFELSYPYDRGTNYAVKVGKKTAEAILSSST